MFTLEQIKAIHSQVKTGADFPQYVQNLKAIGLAHYDLFVADGHAEYVATTGERLTSLASYAPLPVAALGQASELAHALLIHQQGQTDYPTFCRQAAEAGVEKWTVDALALTCSYYDRQGQVLATEIIPLP